MLSVSGANLLDDLLVDAQKAIDKREFRITRTMNADLKKKYTSDDLRSLDPTSVLGKAVLHVVKTNDKYKNELLNVRVRRLFGEKVTRAEEKNAHSQSSFSDNLRHAIRAMLGGWILGGKQLIEDAEKIIDDIESVSDALRVIEELLLDEHVAKMIYMDASDDSLAEDNDAFVIGHPTAYVCFNNIVQIFQYIFFGEKSQSQSPTDPTEKCQNDNSPLSSPAKKMKMSSDNSRNNTNSDLVSIQNAPRPNASANAKPANDSRNSNFSSSPTHDANPGSNPSPSEFTDVKLLLLDNFSAHRSGPLSTLCDLNHTILLFFPANMTWFLQPLDLTINLVIKAAVRRLTYSITNHKIFYADHDFTHLNSYERHVMQNIHAFNQVKKSSIINGFNTMFSNLLKTLREIKENHLNKE